MQTVATGSVQHRTCRIGPPGLEHLHVVGAFEGGGLGDVLLAPAAPHLRDGLVLVLHHPRLHVVEDRADAADAVAQHQQALRAAAKTESPYGVPYKPNIWGAGWTIQDFGVKQYFFNKAWPEHTSADFYLNALNFVLGVHPGENTQSFASGVGANSAIVAYGVNRADWSYIPGGVISGTALIRPDLPELKVWPFFWQQGEYVMGGGATNFMFLALAARDVFSR